MVCFHSHFPHDSRQSPVSCLLIFHCSCTLDSKGCYFLIIVLFRSVISLLGLFCSRFLVISVAIPLYFIHSHLSSNITYRRLFSILGLVTSCIPLLLFVVSCHSQVIYFFVIHKQSQSFRSLLAYSMLSMVMLRLWTF